MQCRTRFRDREARRAAAVQLFVQRYRRVARAIERMSAERLDALLRHGEDDAPVLSAR